MTDTEINVDPDSFPTTTTQPEEEGGSPKDWIRLQSKDGFSYLVRREVAQASGTIRGMLDSTGGFAEANSRICVINERGMIVEKMAEYMCFKSYYQKLGPREEIPVNQFLERLPPEIVLELLLAADYQDM